MIFDWYEYINSFTHSKARTLIAVYQGVIVIYASCHKSGGKYPEWSVNSTSRMHNRGSFYTHNRFNSKKFAKRIENELKLEGNPADIIFNDVFNGDMQILHFFDKIPRSDSLRTADISNKKYYKPI